MVLDIRHIVIEKRGRHVSKSGAGHDVDGRNATANVWPVALLSVVPRRGTPRTPTRSPVPVGGRRMPLPSRRRVRAVRRVSFVRGARSDVRREEHSSAGRCCRVRAETPETFSAFYSTLRVVLRFPRPSNNRARASVFRLPANDHTARSRFSVISNRAETRPPGTRRVQRENVRNTKKPFTGTKNNNILPLRSERLEYNTSALCFRLDTHHVRTHVKHARRGGGGGDPLQVVRTADPCGRRARDSVVHNDDDVSIC